MPLKPNFQNWEHLQRVCRNLHNYRVRDFWKQERFDKHEREPSIDTPKSTLIQATKIEPNDSAVIMILKILLFEICIGNAARMQPIYYGLPVQPFDEYRMDDHPQVLLYFEEDLATSPDGFARLQAHINFRIMDETSETITKAKAKTLANKIQSVFGNIPTWDFTKGKYIYSYQDRKNGYWLQIYAINKGEAEQVIRKVLSIQNHTYDDDKLKESNAPGKNSITSPGSHIVYGQSVRKKRYRPEKKVRFRYAIMKVDGLGVPIVLYDPYRRCNVADLVSST